MTILTPRAPLVSPSLLRKSGDTSGALGVNIVTHISQTDNLVIIYGLGIEPVLGRKMSKCIFNLGRSP